jgi:hypothetical protein
MRIALAADHAGYVLKDELARWLGEQGHEVEDLGTNGPGASIIRISDRSWRESSVRAERTRASSCAAPASASR